MIENNFGVGMLWINCLGHVDERLISTEQLKLVMERIEAGLILRPEIDIIDSRSSSKRHLHLAALFQEGVEHCKGWIISSQDEQSDKLFIDCCSEQLSGDFEELLHCGAPQKIDRVAILTSENVLTFFDAILKGNYRLGFHQHRILEVFNLI